MAKSTFFVANATVFFLVLLFLVPPSGAEEGLEANSNLFREYISGNGVRFSDVPINRRVQFHFILAFARDYTARGTPTNGRFNIFWNRTALSPAAVQAIKAQHRNVRVAVSIGGRHVSFNPSNVSSWVNNSVASLTRIIRAYRLDGIDIDYERFGPAGTPAVFTNSIGQLISRLKQQKVISFASIAPFDRVRTHYVALWRRYARLIDYVNFQFYTYPRNITVPQFIARYNQQAALYRGGRVLISFSTANGTGGLKPQTGFFTAAQQLKNRSQLEGIFVWSADASKATPAKFLYERRAQALLAIRPRNTIFTEADNDDEADADVRPSNSVFIEANDDDEIDADVGPRNSIFPEADNADEFDADFKPRTSIFTETNNDDEADADVKRRNSIFTSMFTEAGNVVEIDAVVRPRNSIFTETDDEADADVQQGEIMIDVI